MIYISKFLKIGCIVAFAIFSGSLFADQEIVNLILKGDAGKVRKLIETKPAQCNLALDNMNTPLHIAASLGKSEIIKILLPCTVNVNAANSVGTTALMFAVMSDNFDSIELILKTKARTDIIDMKSRTVFGMTESKAVRDLLIKYETNNAKEKANL